MKVILLQDIKGLGQKHEVKNVKDGYARNFLLPKKLAKIATVEAIKTLDKQKAAAEKHKQELKETVEKLAEKLSGQEFHFYPQIGRKGELFGSVRKDDVKQAIEDKFEEAKKFDLDVGLNRSLKEVGEYEVMIHLDHGVKTKIRVIVNQLAI
jgi:large subunit ribosomal protein L9